MDNHFTICFKSFSCSSEQNDILDSPCPILKYASDEINPARDSAARSTFWWKLKKQKKDNGSIGLSTERGALRSYSNASETASEGHLEVVSEMLPPCTVCSDVSSGVHYGVWACEGCKVRLIDLFLSSHWSLAPYSMASSFLCSGITR